MALTKCPRCELNYILDGGSLCTVCREEVHGKVDAGESTALCSVCGEHNTLPGEDMCKSCLAELRSIEMSPTGSDDDAADVDTEIGDEPLSSLNEIEDVEDLEDKDLDLDDENTEKELLEELAEAK